MTWRQPHRYPVVLQLAFAASFVLFLLVYEKLQAHRAALWAWSALQLALAGLLVRGRLRARVRVLRCIRCESTIR
jgi:hypothetical protein